MELIQTVTKESMLVRQVCRDLFKQSNIEYVAFMRFYQGEKFTFLSSHPDILNIYHQERFFESSWIPSLLEKAKKGKLSYWCMNRLINSNEQDVIQKMLNTEFKLFEGIDVILQYNGYVDVFCFSALSPEIYKTNLELLFSFIHYFNFRCSNLIKTNNIEYLYQMNRLEKNCVQNVSIINAKSQNEIYDQFDTKRFYYDPNNLMGYLTKSEYLCAFHLSVGNSVQDVASALGCSHRTVENHLKNIRSKLHCGNLAKLVNKLQDSMIL